MMKNAIKLMTGDVARVVTTDVTKDLTKDVTYCRLHALCQKLLLCSSWPQQPVLSTSRCKDFKHIKVFVHISASSHSSGQCVSEELQTDP